MEYRQLANTTIPVSEIGFGCMSLGKNTEAESIQLIHKAIDAGINYFDTADIYDNGANEVLLGKALRPHRKNVILATKVGNVIRSPTSKSFDWNPTKAYILQAIDDSLRRLQTDYIDLYQLHGGTINDPIDETIEAFELLKQQGKILHYGISSIRPNVIKEYVKRSAISSVMLQYNLLDRRPEEEMLDLLHQHHISVLVRGVLAQGLLADTSPKEYLQHTEENVNEIKILLTGITGSERKNITAAIDFVLLNVAVTSAVIGFRTKGQLENVLSNSFSLKHEHWEMLREKVPVKKYVEHR